jgi:flagellar hook-associated protein 2
MVTSTSSSSSSSNAASIDVAAVVQQLMTVENKPLDAINAKIANKELVISDLGTIKGKLSAFGTALSAFESADSYNATTASSTNTSSVTAASSNGTQVGNYDIAVTTLAKPSRYALTGYTSSSAKITLGSSFSLTVGSTTYSNSTIKSAIGSTPTITELADWINGLGANVSASVVSQDSTGTNQLYALTIQATKTGTDNAVTLSDTSPLTASQSATTEVASATFTALSSGQAVSLGGRTFTAGTSGATASQVAAAFAQTASLTTGTSTDGSSVGTFSGAISGWTVSSSSSIATFTATTSGTHTDLTASTGSSHVSISTTTSGAAAANPILSTTDAANSTFTVNGTSFTRSSNSVSDVVDGLALELTGEGTSAVVKVSQGTDSSQTTIQNLITAYNDLMASYKSMTANSSNSSKPGSFANSPTMLSFISEIKSKLSKGVSYGTNYGSEFSLSYIGIDMQLDGTLKFNSTNYASAVNSGLQSILSQGVTVGLSTYGYEKANVSFQALSEGQTLVLGGLTFTAGTGGATATEVASAFANSTTGRTHGDALGTKTVTGGTISGTLGTWNIDSFSLYGSGATFTSSVAGNVTDLENTGTGTATISTSNDSLSTFINTYSGTNGYLVNLINNETEDGYSLATRKDELQTRLNSIQNSYINQYSALNALLFQLSSTSTALTGVLASLTNTKN